jgi:type I restriction enzyme S subunit
MIMQDNEKKPALRFKGFTDPWEQRKVGDHLIPSKLPGHTGVDARKLTVKLWGKGVVEKTDSYGGSEHTQYYVRHAGQFMYGKLDFLHAAFGIVPAELDNYESTLDSPAFDLSEINGKFLVSRVCKEDFYLKYGTIANGSRKAKRIHEDTFMDMPILVPELEEQERVAALLEALDTLITLHQRKYEKLVNIKKSMLDKMFPKNGASVPEIRFKGFTDPWEQRKLGEIAVFSKGVGYSKNDLCEEGTPIILYGRLYTKYETCIFDVDTFVKEKAGGVYSKGGEVIVPASGETAEDISIASVVVKPGILLGGDLNIVSPTAEYDSAFLALTISSGATHKYLSSLAQGKSVVHLHNADIQSVSAKFPTKREQEKIHLLFGKIDTLITLHQRKLEKLQNIKKSCLEKMFV